MKGWMDGMVVWTFLSSFSCPRSIVQGFMGGDELCSSILYTKMGNILYVFQGRSLETTKPIFERNK